jgi:hypothetical protein
VADLTDSFGGGILQLLALGDGEHFLDGRAGGLFGGGRSLGVRGDRGWRSVADGARGSGGLGFIGRRLAGGERLG